jgi:hypothetical protein
MTIFATIEHSGSQETIRTMCWNVVMRWQLADDTPVRSQVTWIHLTDEEMQWLRKHRHNHRIVTTRRDVGEIVKSWELRGKDMSALPEQLRNYEELLTMEPWVIGLGGRDQ